MYDLATLLIEAQKKMDENYHEEKDISELIGKIVVLEGLLSGDYIMMLNKCDYTGSIKRVIEKKYINIREASIKEKECWFEHYDKLDIKVVSIYLYRDWSNRKANEAKDSK